MKVPKFQDSGKNIGYAHIVYSDNESLEKVKFYFYLFQLDLKKILFCNLLYRNSLTNLLQHIAYQMKLQMLYKLLIQFLNSFLFIQKITLV